MHVSISKLTSIFKVLFPSSFVSKESHKGTKKDSSLANGCLSKFHKRYPRICNTVH